MSKTPRYDIRKLNNPEVANTFNEHITSCLLVSNPSDDCQQQMNKIENALITASQEILGTQKSQNTTWITEKTKQYIHKKQNIRKNHGPSSLEYKIAKSNSKKLCKIDKITYIENLHIELQTLPITQQYYRIIKLLKLEKDKSVSGWSIKASDGSILTERNEIIARWHEFYRSLYHSDRDAFVYFEETDDIIPDVLFDELLHAMSILKDGKAPGPDGITVEMLRAGGECLHKELLQLINMIIEHRQIPSQLLLSEIILLFKKGDLLNCTNYRPISLLSHVYKLLMQIIYNRIKVPLTDVLQTNQAAYQHGRGTVEQIQILQQITEKCNEFQRECVICFVDFTKAFDSVNQQKLWNALKEFTCLNPAYINLLAKLYERSQTRVRTDVGLTDFIDLLKGVKQGDIPSGNLFCLALMVVLLRTFEDFDGGIKIGGIPHTDEAYADDIALITVCTEQMNEVLERLRINAEEFGLSINIKKTKVMLIGASNDPPCVIGDHILDVVMTFEYLGRVLSNDADDMKAVKNRISKGWQAFGKVKSVLTSRHIPMAAKRKTYETYIVPCILYATETFVWRSELLQKFQKFENDAMRWMACKRLRDRTSIKRLYELTGLQKITHAIMARKARWYGHVKRSNLPVRAAVEGMIEGKRRRGRPKRRWRSDIMDWIGGDLCCLNALVHDRSAWRTVCKKLAKEGSCNEQNK